MKLAGVLVGCVLAVTCAVAQTAPNSATVPVPLDHNRIIIDVRFPLPGGTTKRVPGWGETMDPQTRITRRRAAKLGLDLPGAPRAVLGETSRPVQPPGTLLIGGRAIHPPQGIETRALLDRESVGPGLSAEVS